MQIPESGDQVAELEREVARLTELAESYRLAGKARAEEISRLLNERAAPPTPSPELLELRDEVERLRELESSRPARWRSAAARMRATKGG